MPLRQLYPNREDNATSEAEKIDIIAVHGLNPRSKKAENHAWNTWREPQDDKGRLWLRDDLPKSVPHSRIFLYEYDSTAVYGIDRGTFIDKANELLEAIRIKRYDDEYRPIILLGHSLGGLLIEQALVNAHNNPKYTPIQQAVSGVAFFGTPHNGGNTTLVALGGAAAKIALGVGFQKGDNIIQTLESGSLFTDTLQELWRHQLLKYDIISFWGSYDNIVPKESSRFGLPGDKEHIVKLNADHHGVCRFGRSQIDEDNLELVEANMKELYKRGLKTALTQQIKCFEPDVKSTEQRRKFLQGLVKLDDSTGQGIDYESYRFRNPNRVPGTCTWFLEHFKYLFWRSELSSSLLWLSADPGCGKSVLASFLVEELQATASQQALKGNVCYFFFKNDSKQQSGAVYALRAILHQLLSKRTRLPRSIITEYENKGEVIFSQFSSLWNLFKAAATEAGESNTICILDGLDECDFNLNELLTAMVEFYESIKSKTNMSNAPYLKIIVTSRPENAIKTRFSKLPTIRLRGEDETEATEHDIGLVVAYTLNEMVGQGLLSQHSGDLLKKNLVVKADQTFLWVALILALIKDATEYGASELELLAVLDDRSIDSLYNRFLSNKSRHPEAEKKVRVLLQIIIAAPRPLTLKEMDTAISLRPERVCIQDLEPNLHTSPENYFKKLCGHFIRCKDQKIYLVHQTAREFLIRQDEKLGFGAPERGPWEHWVLPEVSHTLLAVICIQYLFFKDFEDGVKEFVAARSRGHSDTQIREQCRSDYPFMQYAASYWHYHARLGQTELNESMTRNLQILGNTRSTRFWTWFYIYAPRWSAAITTESTVLGYLALGNYAHLEDLNSSTCPPCFRFSPSLNDIQAIKSVYTPFEWAEKEQHYSVSELLRQLNPKACRLELTKSLWAALRKQPPLDDYPTKAGYAFSGNSIANPYSVVNILGADLWNAVNLGDEILVSSILTRTGIEINYRDNAYGTTPLWRAADLGHAVIVRQLLNEPSIEINAQNRHKVTPLCKAAEMGHSAIVGLLLKAPGIEINARDEHGTTPLWGAAYRGHSAVVRLLLKAPGIEINVKDKHGTTPLSWAINNGHLEVVRLLRPYFPSISAPT